MVIEDTDTAPPAKFTFDRARQNAIARAILRGVSKAAASAEMTRFRSKQSSRPINDLIATTKYDYQKIDDAEI